MKKILLPFAFLFCVTSGFAQLTVNGSLTPQQLVQTILIGNGVSASNVTYNGVSVAIGSFDGTVSNIGIPGGLLLTTGDIANAVGPNNSDSQTTDNNGAGDADLDIVSGFITNDASVLEFDFIPASDTLRFNYVFGSEEYPEYAGGSVNDAFGFFISGPGISGPYSNNSQNIAIIPGTTTPVTINDLNNGDNDCFLGGPNGPCSNCQFYVDNCNGSTVQYDGFTTPLTALAVVQCGQTYHIKIAIADGGDGQYDSGVFLEAGSFSSNLIEILLSNSLNADTLVPEGCADGIFQLVRESSTQSQTILVSTSGTATSGVDYTQLPDTIYFAPNQDTVELTFDIFGDVPVEGTEMVTLTISIQNDCGDTIEVSRTLYIIENYIVQAQSNDLLINCPMDSVLLTGLVFGGYPDFSYNWSNGAVGDSIYIQPTGSDTLILSVVDFCGVTSQNDTVVVTYQPAQLPQLSVIPVVDTICPGSSAPVSVNIAGGLGPFSIEWNNGSFGNTIFVNPDQTSGYWASVTDGCNREVISDTSLIVINPTLQLLILEDTLSVICSEDTVEVHTIVSGGIPTYTYSWNDGSNSDSLIATPDVTMNYSVQVTDQCGDQVQDEVVILVPEYSFELTVVALDSLICQSTLAELSAIAGGGAGSYIYTWSGTDNIQTNLTGDSAYSTLAATTIFTVQVTDYCNNSVSTTVTVETEVCDVIVPNVFTPNGDGFNDTFFVENLDQYPGSEIKIYNRWGRKVHESDDYKNDWDGEKLAEGTYFYVLSVSDPEQGEKRGHVTILKN